MITFDPRYKPRYADRAEIRKDGHWSANGLIGMWMMNEGAGGRVWDLCGRNHGTLYGAAKLNGLGLITEINSSYALAPNSTFRIRDNGATIWAIVSTSSTSGVKVAWSKNSGSAWFGLNGNALSFSINGSIKDATNLISNGRPHFICARLRLVGTAVYCTIYQDSTSTTETQLSATSDDANYNPIYLGGFVSGGYQWSGVILASSIHSRALSAAEILELYRAPWQMIRLPRNVGYSFGSALSSVGNTRQMLWDVRSVVGGSRQAVWDDRATVGVNREALWTTRATTGNTREVRFNTRATVGSQREMLWNVLTSIGNTRSMVWTTRKIAGTTRVVLWNTESDRAAYIFPSTDLLGDMLDESVEIDTEEGEVTWL